MQQTLEGYLDAYSELANRHGPRAYGAAADAVTAAVETLPPPQRRVIVLHYFEGLE